MKYLTAEEVGLVIRESPDNVRRRCANGQIAAKKLGQSWRISEDALAAFMAPKSTGSLRNRLTKRQRQQLGQAS